MVLSGYAGRESGDVVVGIVATELIQVSFRRDVGGKTVCRRAIVKERDRRRSPFPIFTFVPISLRSIAGQNTTPKDFLVADRKVIGWVV